MHVRDLMTQDVHTCSVGTDLATVGMIMWWKDCGAIPVTDASRRVVGMITDRDIAIAVATRHSAPDLIKVEDVIGRAPVSVRPHDSASDALLVFAKERVRRLPVVGTSGEAVGVLSLNDVILHTAARGATPALPKEDVLRTLRAVCEHWSEVLAEDADTEKKIAHAPPRAAERRRLHAVSS